MSKDKMVCIVCPMGCIMDVEIGDEIKVSGNTCKRGFEYAVKESTNPTRVITSTVGVNNGELQVVPVKTKGEVPKNMIMDCMKVIRKIRVNAPVKTGDVLLDGILGTGVSIVATRDVEATEQVLNDIDEDQLKCCG